jgi:hypothetical protein
MFGFRNGKGAIVVDGKQVGETLQCVHCGMHWEYKPGSGRKRGFCNFCNGVVCGQDYCMSGCYPLEARIELTEAVDAKDARNEMKIRNRFPGIHPI